jgi:hypothetical protein
LRRRFAAITSARRSSIPPRCARDIPNVLTEEIRQHESAMLEGKLRNIDQ